MNKICDTCGGEGFLRGGKPWVRKAEKGEHVRLQITPSELGNILSGGVIKRVHRVNGVPVEVSISYPDYLSSEVCQDTVLEERERQDGGTGKAEGGRESDESQSGP